MWLTKVRVREREWQKFELPTNVAMETLGKRPILGKIHRVRSSRHIILRPLQSATAPAWNSESPAHPLDWGISYTLANHASIRVINVYGPYSMPLAPKNHRFRLLCVIHQSTLPMAGIYLEFVGPLPPVTTPTESTLLCLRRVNFSWVGCACCSTCCLESQQRISHSSGQFRKLENIRIT